MRIDVGMDLHSIDLLPDFPTAGEVASYLRLKQDKVLDLHRLGVLPGYRGGGTVQFDRRLVGDFVERLEHLASVEPVGTSLDAVLAAAPTAAAAGRAGASRSRVRHHAGQLARGVQVSQDFFSLEEVAVLLRASSRMVIERARDGRLAGFKIGRTWIFPAYAVARMLGAPDPVAACCERDADVLPSRSAELAAAGSARARRLLSLEDAAAYVQLSPRTLVDRARAGKVAGVKDGRQWKFWDADLDDYLDAQRRPVKVARARSTRPVRGRSR